MYINGLLSSLIPVHTVCLLSPAGRAHCAVAVIVQSARGEEPLEGDGEMGEIGTFSLSTADNMPQDAGKRALPFSSHDTRQYVHVRAHSCMVLNWTQYNSNSCIFAQSHHTVDIPPTATVPPPGR